MSATFLKKPAEQFSIGMDFTAAAAVGATLASATAVVLDKEDNAVVTSALLLSGTATCVGQVAKVTLKAGGGRPNRAYLVIFKATMSNADVLEENADLHVEPD